MRPIRERLNERRPFNLNLIFEEFNVASDRPSLTGKLTLYGKIELKSVRQWLVFLATHTASTRAIESFLFVSLLCTGAKLH